MKRYKILLTIKKENIRENNKTRPLKLNMDFHSKPKKPLKKTNPIIKNTIRKTQIYSRSLFLFILFIWTLFP